jgi:uncharacterized protein
LHPALKQEPEEAELTPSGRFSGYASTFDDKQDLVEDIVVYGAFAGLSRSPFPLLDHHKQDIPLGLIHVSQNLGGLYAQGTPNMDLARAREMVSLMRQGAVSGLSIGYTAKNSCPKNGVRYLTKLELHEVSLCSFPANPNARVTSLKAAELEAFSRLLHYAGRHCRVEAEGSRVSDRPDVVPLFLADVQAMTAYARGARPSEVAA